MKRRRLFMLFLSGVLVVCGALALRATAQQGDPKRSEGTEVLTRGPVHEAFAEVVAYNPKPGIAVAKQPPAAIEEQPPEQKPTGDHVVWIPGYWAWDEEQKNFLWVSGVWRDVPPGRQWVPGYWTHEGDRFQWISGYWTSADTNDVQYLPEPPQSLETGPNVAPASDDDVWVPGNWVWQDNHYAWSPGYWCIPEPGWVWVPNRYIWTPRGCVFARGYWDYPIGQRGVLFAPVRFTSPLYLRDDYRFSPAIAIASDLLTDFLFCRPSYCHYYFGDYFAAEYGGRGIYPWFSYSRSRVGYDPIYAYERRIGLQGDSDWERRVETNFRQRQRDVDIRPPHTLADMQRRAASATTPDRSVALAMPMSQLAQRSETAVRLEPLDTRQRQQLGQVSHEVQKLSEARQKVETEKSARTPAVAGEAKKPTTARLPQSPLGVKSGVTSPRTEKAPSQQASPKPVPRAERPPAPAAEPRPKPRAEPRGEPKVQPRREPKAEPRVEPRGETRPTPRSEPSPREDTRPSGGERSKGHGR